MIVEYVSGGPVRVGDQVRIKRRFQHDVAFTPTPRMAAAPGFRGAGPLG